MQEVYVNGNEFENAGEILEYLREELGLEHNITDRIRIKIVKLHRLAGCQMCSFHIIPFNRIYEEL